MTRIITLPIECNTVRRLKKFSVVAMSLLIWIAWGWMFKTWLDIHPTTGRSIDGFVGVVVFLIVAFGYTWLCVIPKLPKFQCIKDGE